MTPELKSTVRGEEVAAPKRFSARSLVNTLCRPHMVVMLWIAAGFHLAILIADLPGRVTRFDFSVFYASAVAMLMGLNPYLADLSRIGDPLHLEIRPLIHTTSTPTFLLCFKPFGYLPELTAYRIWFAISVATFIAATVLLLGARDSGLTRPLKLVLAAAMMLYAPLGDHIADAQVQILILLMLVLVMRWLANGREVSAGLMLALAIALRAFPLVLAFYLMITHRWRALVSTAIGLTLIGIVTIAGLGWDIVRTFIVGAELTVSHHPVALPINVALGSFVTRLFWYLMGPALPSGLDFARKVAVACSAIAILGFSVRATLRTAGGRDANLTAYGLWVVVSVMLSPIAWIHYMVLFFIPFIQIAIAANRGACRPSAMWAVVASYFLISLSIGLREPARNLGGDTLYFVVAEGAFISVLLAYVAAYLFTIDDRLLTSSVGPAGKHLLSAPLPDRAPTATA